MVLGMILVFVSATTADHYGTEGLNMVRKQPLIEEILKKYYHVLARKLHPKTNKHPLHGCLIT